MCQCAVPASDPDALSIFDQLDFIDDKLHRVMSRCRLLQSLSDPRGLENERSRVVEIDRENLSNIFDDLADELDIALFQCKELRHAIPLEIGRAS